MSRVNNILKLIFLLILIQILIPRSNLYSQTDTNLIKLLKPYSGEITSGNRCWGNGGIQSNIILNSNFNKDTLLLFIEKLKHNSKSEREIEQFLNSNYLGIKSYIYDKSLEHTTQEIEYIDTILYEVRRSMLDLNNSQYTIEDSIQVDQYYGLENSFIVKINTEVEKYRNKKKNVQIQFILIDGNTYFLKSISKFK